MVRAKIIGYENISGHSCGWYAVVSYKGKKRWVKISPFTFGKLMWNRRKTMNINIKKHKFLWFEWETWEASD